jgi:hypothetical protein
MTKTFFAALLAFLPLNAFAADLFQLQRLGASEMRATAPAAITVPQPKAGASSFRVADNAPLRADFTRFLDYRGNNGQTIFPYAMRDVRYYKLTGWPRHLLVQLDDHTLPDFHNFLVLSLHGASETAYARLLTVPEKICSLDAACDRVNTLKKTQEERARASVTAWEAPYFSGVKTSLLAKVASHYDSEKFAKLDRSEVAAAKARLAGLLGRAAQAGNGKASLIAENDREWRLEHCGASSAELLERMRQAPPEEQDRIILRCGFVLDAEWLIKKEYDNAAIAGLNAACPASPANPAGYCPAHNDWLRVYPVITDMKEVPLTNGGLEI